MSDISWEIGLARASAALPPPKSSACGLEMNDQVTASLNPRAASARPCPVSPDLPGCQNLLPDRAGPRQRRQRHPVKPDDAHDLLNEIGLAFDVRTPARGRDLDGVATTGNPEAERFQRQVRLRKRHLDTRTGAGFPNRETR